MSARNCDIRAALAHPVRELPWPKAHNPRDEEILACAKRLPGRLAVTVIRRYGLDGQPPMTLQQVAEVLAPGGKRITREAVRQRVAKGVRLMRWLLAGRR